MNTRRRTTALLIGLSILGGANGAEPMRDPLTVLSALADRMYTVGETTGKAADMMEAEVKAADEVRRYVASGATDGLLAKEDGGQSPLAAAAYMGYPNVIEALLTSKLVKSHVNDPDRMGMTPWIAATFSMKQSLWTCNPAAFEDPYKFVPMLVTQPYYLLNPTPPYRKARALLEAAGAVADLAAAKALWLSSCQNGSAGAKAKVQASSDLQMTLQELGAADLIDQAVKMRNKAAEAQQR